MTFSCITSWQINREKVEAVTDFIFLGCKITAEGNFSREIKRHAPWKESNNSFRQHIKKHIYHFAKYLYAAAAAAKLLQLCQTPCDSIDSSPPGSAVPGILQARTLEWVAISFSNT